MVVGERGAVKRGSERARERFDQAQTPGYVGGMCPLMVLGEIVSYE